VLSAPPSIMKLPTKLPGALTDKSGATIEAKPQLKHPIGDVTRFMPTALRVKRETRDAKGRLIKTASGKDESSNVKQNPQISAPTKDDAYDAFMREMENLL